VAHLFHQKMEVSFSESFVGSRTLFVGSKPGCVGSLFVNNSFKNNRL